MLKFKKDSFLEIWVAEGNGREFEIVKNIEDGKTFIVYIDGNRYAEAKTLKTAKKYANEYFN